MRNNKASQTAKLVADWLHFQLHEPETAHLASDQWREVSTHFIRHHDLKSLAWDILVKKQVTHTLYDKLVPQFYQSFAKHLLFRKLWIERQVKQFAQENPLSEVIIVGAGLDTLTLRLSGAFISTQFIEVDHPATQQQKLKTISKLPQNTLSASSNIQWLPADLTVSKLSEILPSTDLPRLFVMEGLLMYLSQSTVASLFEDLTQCTPQAKAAFSYLSPWQYPPFAQALSHIASYWLKLSGEPFQWILTTQALQSTLEHWNWNVEQLSTTADEAKYCGFAFHQTIAEKLCFATFSK